MDHQVDTQQEGYLMGRAAKGDRVQDTSTTLASSYGILADRKAAYLACLEFGLIPLIGVDAYRRDKEDGE
jgi:hypothetical protein